MFEVTASQATSILAQITSVGNGLITSLVALAGVFLAIMGLRWVLHTLRSAMHL